MRRTFLFALIALQPFALRASVCTATTLDTYLVPGFSCSFGNVGYSSFGWSSNFGGGAFETAHLPSEITVTPITDASGTGFTFGNLGLSFTGRGSNVTSSINFHASTLADVITGASLKLGAHSATSPGGTAVAFFQDDSGSVFLLGNADPITYSFGAPYDVVRTSDSATFPGIAGTDFASGGAAVVDGFTGGTSTLDAYTVQFSLAVPTTGTPEPGTFGLLLAAVVVGASWGGFRRRE